MGTQLTRAAIDDALTTLQNAAAATGNGTPLDVKGWAVAAVQVTGSFTATVSFEVTLDGSTWVAAQAVNVATGATSTTATAAADFLVAVAGFEYFRTRVTWTSGTSVTTKARCTPFDSSVTNAAAGAETVTANQGTANAGGANSWPVNNTQVAGTATDTNSGSKSAGTQRVVLATDSPALTNILGPQVASTTAVAAAVTAPPVFAFTSVFDGANWHYVGSGNAFADAHTGADSAMVSPYLFNGTTWDRHRNNSDTITCGITAAGVTSTQTGADQTNFNWRGLHVVLDMTTVGSGSVTLEIDGKDPVSGKYYAILTGAAVVANGTNVYKVYPGITVSPNVSASDVLPRTWRIKVTANNANATTYTVGAMLIV